MGRKLILCIGAFSWPLAIIFNSKCGDFFDNLPSSTIYLHAFASFQLGANGSRGDPVCWHFLTLVVLFDLISTFPFPLTQMIRVRGGMMVSWFGDLGLNEIGWFHLDCSSCLSLLS